MRTAPGGATHNIFGGDEDDDALSLAPPRGPTTVTEQNAPTNTIANEPESDRPAFKPSRRVREMPGGRDSIADVSVLCSESMSSCAEGCRCRFFDMLGNCDRSTRYGMGWDVAIESRKCASIVIRLSNKCNYFFQYDFHVAC